MTIAFGALSRGVGAELIGGNFWQSAIIGGIVAGLNHEMHRYIQKIRIDSNADEWLENAGYKAKENISQMDESARDTYVKLMRKNVDPANILYNDANNPDIVYDSAISDYGKYFNQR